MDYLYKKGKAFFYALLFLIFPISFFSNKAQAQDPAQYGTPFAGVPDPRDVNMYQVLQGTFSAAGNFAGVTARLDALKSLGINVVYLMPINPIGTDPRAVRSPYCIKNFKGVRSDYGTLADLRALVDGAHSRGMAVMLDFVVNQTSWDHPWIKDHPDWYVRNSAGVIQPMTPYNDVAALNLNNTATRAAIIDALRYWIFAANIDGYRFDFASNPTLDFWKVVNANLRSITSHKLLLFAESARRENFQAGFDFNFGEIFYDNLKKINESGNSVTTLKSATDAEYQFATGSQQVVRFTANHDTETAISPMTLFDGHAGVAANFLVSAYMRGVPFMTSGQEIDFAQLVPFPWNTVKFNWTSNPASVAEYSKILKFRTASNAIRRGTLANYSTANVCAFTKIAGTEMVSVITNLRNATSSFVVPTNMAGTYKDAFTGEAVTLTSGALISLSAFQYRVLTKTGTPPATTFTINFYKPSTWGTNIRIYYWGTVPTNGLPATTWPGIAMTNKGNGWYSYTLPNTVTSTNIIFNDGTTQSANYNRTSGGWCMNNMWYDFLPATVVSKDCNYAGTTVALPPGDYTMAQLNARGILNDDISSLRVTAGYKVTLYTDDNYLGTSLALTADNSCLTTTMNDKVTSLKVTATTAAAQRSVTSEAVDNVIEENSFAYPNPATNVLNISPHAGIKSGRFKIISSKGLSTIVGNFNGESIDVSNLREGLYTIIINDGVKTVKAKFIKK